MLSNKARQRLVLTALVLVFSMPFGAAWFIYSFSDIGKNDKGGNYGELIVPTVSMPDVTLTDRYAPENSHHLYGKWSLVYMMAGDCTLECRRGLDMILGVRTALLKDSGRIQIVVAGSEAEVEKALGQNPGNHNGQKLLLLHLGDTAKPGYSLSPAQEGVFAQGKFYIIDPLGNLVLSYSANSDPEGLISDLKRLLRYSRIG